MSFPLMDKINGICVHQQCLRDFPKSRSFFFHRLPTKRRSTFMALMELVKQPEQTKSGGVPNGNPWNVARSRSTPEPVWAHESQYFQLLGRTESLPKQRDLEKTAYQTSKRRKLMDSFSPFCPDLLVLRRECC